MPCQYVLVLFNERDLEFQKEITETNETLETIADLIARAENLDVNDACRVISATSNQWQLLQSMRPSPMDQLALPRCSGRVGTASTKSNMYGRSDRQRCDCNRSVWVAETAYLLAVTPMLGLYLLQVVSRTVVSHKC